MGSGGFVILMKPLWYSHKKSRVFSLHRRGRPAAGLFAGFLRMKAFLAQDR
jgi:hypothetical protein